MQEATATRRSTTTRRRPAARPVPLVVSDARRVAPRLLAWYRRTARDLPWRRSSDPYHVWLSEVMLQQTQVERVKDYFHRFLTRFPTVTRLARADEADVLRLWEGLGYYRRARQLHAAAQEVVREHGGHFPDTVAALRTLPGVGRYTAAAVASIAFGKPEPIVEANSRRVLARLAGHTGVVTGPREEPLWQLAATLLPARSPGRFNQALMDLGALVCTPRRPLCDRCPLAGSCAARRDGTIDAIPASAPRRAAVIVRERAVVYRRGGRVLVERRGPGAWWEGLWDFPRRPRRGTTGRRLGTIAYGVTHHRVTCDVVVIDDSRAAPAGRGFRWISVAALGRLPLSAPGRRIARLLADG